MTSLTEIGEENTGRVRLKVVGVGGCGCNAINRMIRQRIGGVEFVAINTDAQALNDCLSENRLQIGQRETRGQGAGGNCEAGQRAAEESLKEIESTIEGSHMVFLAAGMGGGTGTGAAPVIARVAREAGAITVGVVTSPFEYEGDVRSRQAESGIEELRKEVDTLIVIPNDRLRTLADPDSTLTDVLDMANDVLLNAVDGICRLISTPGQINRDFQDVKTVITKGGGAMIGTGRASGPSRASEAAKWAVSGPLLDGVSIEGAQALLIHVQASAELKFNEFDEAVRTITNAAGSQAHVFLGSTHCPDLGDEMRVTVIATGFGQAVEREPEDVTYRTYSQFNAETKPAVKDRESIPMNTGGSGPQLDRRADARLPSFLKKEIN